MVEISDNEWWNRNQVFFWFMLPTEVVEFNPVSTFQFFFGVKRANAYKKYNFPFKITPKASLKAKPNANSLSLQIRIKFLYKVYDGGILNDRQMRTVQMFDINFTVGISF